MSETVLVRGLAPIVTVVLNRPERLNALNREGWERLSEIMRQISAQDDIRCVVMRGAGASFCAGADISAFRDERTAESAREYGETEYEGIAAVAACRHPTVALIEGVCVGGGLAIASACDLRICGLSSRFGVPANRLGLTMSYDELRYFQRIVGATVAREILLEAQVFGAEHARHLGLVTRIVDDELVQEEAYETAERVADGAPLVNRWHKKFLQRLDDPTPLTDAERQEGYKAFDTEDYRIGYEAFLNKTKPEFKGK